MAHSILGLHRWHVVLGTPQQHLDDVRPREAEDLVVKTWGDHPPVVILKELRYLYCGCPDCEFVKAVIEDNEEKHRQQRLPGRG